MIGLRSSARSGREHVVASRTLVIRLATAALIAVAAAAVLAAPARATDAGEATWTRTWGGAESDERFALVEPCAGGDVIVAGRIRWATTQYIVVARYAPSGKRRWIRTIDAGATCNDSLYDLAVDRFGNSIVVGCRQAASPDEDILVARVTKGGRQAWRRVIDAGSHYDEARAVAVDRDGDVYVACMRQSADYQASLTYRLRARNGATIWTRELTGDHTLTFATDIAIDGHRNTYLTGDCSADAGSSMVVVKLSPGGQVRWTRETLATATTTAQGSRIALAPGGVVYAAGSVATGIHTADLVLVKYRTNGDFAWRDDWDASGVGIGGTQVADLVTDRYGNVFAAGSCGASTHIPGRAFVARWRPNATRWSLVDPEVGDTATGFVGVAPDDAGGCYVAGNTTYNFDDSHTLVAFGYYARLRSSGALRWERAYARLGCRTSFLGIAAWPGSGLCVVGDSRDPSGHQGQALVQLRRK